MPWGLFTTSFPIKKEFNKTKKNLGVSTKVRFRSKTPRGGKYNVKEDPQKNGSEESSQREGPTESELFFKEHGRDIVVVLPAYNEAKAIKEVMKELLANGVHLVVVDDGSDDDTYQIAEKILRSNTGRVHLYRHPLNRGVGTTLKTGIEAALFIKPQVVVTFDADGQHHAQDLYAVCRPIIEGQADVVIGNRDFHEMPFRKGFGNRIMNIITLIFYGHWVKDSQSGFRAFNRKTALLLELHSSGYGICSEMVGEVFKHGLILEEVPITTIYTDYSLSKGTDTKIGLKILAKLIREVFK
jgi:glycosyltransferase involved in cell wall biosynthesis